MIRRLRGVWQSLLVRYMISYTAIMVVLFFGVGMYMNAGYARTIRQNTIDSNINRLGNIQAQTEEMVASMLKITNQISLSPYIKPFRFQDDPAQAYTLKKQLLPYTLTNDISDQLFLTFSGDDYLYSSSTSIPLSLFLNELMRFENVTPEALGELLKSRETLHILPCQRVDSPLLDGKSARMVTAIVSLGIGETQKTGSVIFMIKESVFHRLFAEAIAEPRNTYILHNGEVLAQSLSLPVPDESVLASLRENEDMLATDLSVAGKGYLLIAQRGQKYGMQYATLIPLSTVRQSTLNAMLGLLAFLFALSVPCMLLTFYFANRQVRPIRELRHLFDKGAQESNDFSVIQSGIEALVGRNEDLHTRLDQSLPARKAGFVMRFVKGRFKSRQEAIDAAREFSMEIDRRLFVIALVSAPDRDAPPPTVEAIFARGGEGIAGYGVELVAREQLLFALFFDEAEAFSAWKASVEGAPGDERRAAVLTSGLHEDFTRAGSAYLEASAAFDDRFVQDNLAPLRAGDIAATKSAASAAPSLMSPKDLGVHPVIRDIMAYLHANFPDPNLSMSGVADTYGMSAVRLSLDFKEATGMSPSEYLLRLRMEKAQARLRNSGDTVKEIGLSVGYYDASGFIRRFKQFTGVTPAQYRQGRRDEGNENGETDKG